MTHIVIAGAGHAGGAVAAYLRQYGFDGDITLIGEEAMLPYQRPPLSKGWLLGEVELEDLLLRPAPFYEQNRIRVRLGCPITSLDRGERCVHLHTGENVDYDHLVIATGCSPVVPPIPGACLEGVMTLRSARDAMRLRAEIGPGTTVVVVGGGYIGLEVAAAARSLGAEVVVVERAPRVLARVAHPVLSSHMASLHARNGVRIETGRCVARIDASGGYVHRVELDDGRTIECDAVLLGVGGQPNDGFARAAGLACDNGIIVDLEARTSDPAIYAVGDVTLRPLPHYDRMARLESVPNAIEQAKQVAALLTGRPAPVPEVPWQWSDQYDAKVQIAGFPAGADEVVVRRGADPDALALFHFAGERLLAVEAVNAPAEFMAGRQIIGRGFAIDKARLSDTSLSMKQLMSI